MSRRSESSCSPRFTSRAACNALQDRKSTRLNSSHLVISYAVFCLKKKKKENKIQRWSPEQQTNKHQPTHDMCNTQQTLNGLYHNYRTETADTVVHYRHALPSSPEL